MVSLHHVGAFVLAVKKVGMVHQANDFPCPTTNTPPLTIHLAHIVCAVLRCQCPREDDRDGKEDDWTHGMVYTSDQFS